MELKEELKNLIIETLDLDEITPDDIVDDEPLFIDGLGLDSIDALELGMALKKKYNMQKFIFIHCCSLNSKRH